MRKVTSKELKVIYVWQIKIKKVDLPSLCLVKLCLIVYFCLVLFLISVGSLITSIGLYTPWNGYWTTSECGLQVIESKLLLILLFWLIKSSNLYNELCLPDGFVAIDLDQKICTCPKVALCINRFESDIVIFGSFNYLLLGSRIIISWRFSSKAWHNDTWVILITPNFIAA